LNTICRRKIQPGTLRVVDLNHNNKVQGTIVRFPTFGATAFDDHFATLEDEAFRKAGI
jgi:hypothetical protein